MKGLDGAAKCLQSEYTIARKAQLLKWKVSKKQKLEKILPLDDKIFYCYYYSCRYYLSLAWPMKTTRETLFT